MINKLWLRLEQSLALAALLLDQIASSAYRQPHHYYFWMWLLFVNAARAEA